MRPVEKGASPRVYQQYRDAFEDLEDRLGNYCSYCERRIETHLAVEHVQPKSRTPTLVNDWENFLVACGNCNSTKGDKPIILEEYLWPDRDNTFAAFSYKKQGMVEISRSLSSEASSQAQNLLELVGLDKVPANPDQARRPTQQDKRWRRRLEAWSFIEEARDDYSALKGIPEAVRLVVNAAVARGHFSIWMAGFTDHPEIQTALIAAFPGTKTKFF